MNIDKNTIKKIEKIFDKNVKEYTIEFMRPNSKIDTKIIKKPSTLLYIDNVNNYISINNIPLSAIKSISSNNKMYYKNKEENKIENIILDYTKVPDYINGDINIEQVIFDEEIKKEILEDYNDNKKIMKSFFNYLNAKSGICDSLEKYYLKLDNSLKEDCDFINSILHKNYIFSVELVNDFSKDFFENEKCIDFLIKNIKHFNGVSIFCYLNKIDDSIKTKDNLIKLINCYNLPLIFIKYFDENIINDEDSINEIKIRHNKQMERIGSYIPYINTAENLQKIFTMEEIAFYIGKLNKNIIQDKEFISKMLINYNCDIFGDESFDNHIINYYKNNMHMLTLLSYNCPDININYFLKEAEINTQREDGNEKLLELVSTNIYFINWMSNIDIETYFISEIASINNITIENQTFSNGSETANYNSLVFNTDFGKFIFEEFGTIKYKNKESNIDSLEIDEIKNKNKEIKNICQINKLDKEIKKKIINEFILYFKENYSIDITASNINELRLNVLKEKNNIINNDLER